MPRISPFSYPQSPLNARLRLRVIDLITPEIRVCSMNLVALMASLRVLRNRSEIIPSWEAA
jgi:hypothetical protein